MRTRSVPIRSHLVAMVVAAAIAACGCATPYYSMDPSRALVTMAATPPGPALPTGAAAAEGRNQAAEETASADAAPGLGTSRPGPARQMVYTARFEIATPNVEDAMGRFIRSVDGLGGYLEGREDAHVVCRVPADRFQEFVAAMPALGSVLSQSIRNQDVTRKYQDLNLQLETAEWSRRRVLALLDRAEKIEDILKLEEELAKYTALIEGLKGTIRDLSEQIAFSRVEVFFRPKTPEAKMGRPESYSPFPWINGVGAEQVTAGFGPVEGADKLAVADASTLLPGAVAVGPLDGFLVVKRDAAEVKAITPDASKLWVRQFAVPKRGSLEFWSKALKSDLVDHRGYALVEERGVRDAKGNEGVELVFDVTVQGQAQRYLVAVFVPSGPFWQPTGTVRTVEFVAPTATFDKYQAVVRQACTPVRSAAGT